MRRNTRAEEDVERDDVRCRQSALMKLLPEFAHFDTHHDIAIDVLADRQTRAILKAQTDINRRKK